MTVCSCWCVAVTAHQCRGRRSEVVSGKQQLFWQPSPACLAEIQRLGLGQLYQSATTTIRNLDQQQLKEMLVGQLHILPYTDGVFGASRPVMTGCGGVALNWHQTNDTLKERGGADSDYVAFREARLAGLSRPVFSKHEQYASTLYAVGSAMQAANNHCCSPSVDVWAASSLPKTTLDPAKEKDLIGGLLAAGKRLNMHMEIIKLKAPGKKPLVVGQRPAYQLVCASSQQQLQEFVAQAPAEVEQRMADRRTIEAELIADKMLERLSTTPGHVMPKTTSLVGVYPDKHDTAELRRAMAERDIVTFLGPYKKHMGGGRFSYHSCLVLVGLAADIDAHFEDVKQAILTDMAGGSESLRLVTVMRQLLEERQERGGTGVAGYVDVRNAAAEAMNTDWATLQPRCVPANLWDGAGQPTARQAQRLLSNAQRAGSVPHLEALFESWIPGVGLPCQDELDTGVDAPPLLELFSCTVPTSSADTARGVTATKSQVFVALDAAAAAAEKEQCRVAVEERLLELDSAPGATGARGEKRRRERQRKQAAKAAEAVARDAAAEKPRTTRSGRSRS